LRLCLISSQVHSTGLCHLSAFSLLSVIKARGVPETRQPSISLPANA
jgi:hypothetical protein